MSKFYSEEVFDLQDDFRQLLNPAEKEEIK
jgi:hypothetical protein